MASDTKLAELKAQAAAAGIGVGGLDALIGNIYGFATNSGKKNFERISDEQCDELIVNFRKVEAE
jgi:hypothetical protein